MTIKIGRVTLSTPNEINPTARREVERRTLPTGRIEANFVAAGKPTYGLEGREHGSTAQATMDLLEREMTRQGSVYVVDSDSLVPAGWYELQPPEYRKPGGAPRKRPWSMTIEPTDYPWIVRQAEDDEATGTTVADVSGDVDEDSYVDYPTTGSYAAVLEPSGVAGAEAVNLPAGTWRLIARLYAVTTATAQARWKTRSLAPADLQTGADVTITPAGAWTDFDLGTLVVAAANHKANWYSVQVRDTVNAGSHVYVDRVWIVPA